MPKINERTVVLLPAYNEERAIGATLDDVRDNAPGARVVVVDNNSRDRTAEIAHSRGAEVIHIPDPGKGNAVRLAVPRLGDFSYLVMMDSDYTYPAKHLPEVVETLATAADVVAGYRHYREPGAMPAINAAGNRMLSLCASVLYRKAIRDVCTGLWGFRSTALRQFVLTSPRFTLEADLFANSVRLGCRIKHIPISYRARMNGDQSKLKVRDGLEIGLFLWRNRQLYIKTTPDRSH